MNIHSNYKYLNLNNNANINTKVRNIYIPTVNIYLTKSKRNEKGNYKNNINTSK